MTTISIPYLNLETPPVAVTIASLGLKSVALAKSATVKSATSKSENLTHIASSETSENSQLRSSKAGPTSPLSITPAERLPTILNQLEKSLSELARHDELANGWVNPSRVTETAIRQDARHWEANAPIELLVDSILDRFPLAASTTLLFVGTETNPHTSMTCGSVAATLANRKIGNVLLVDGSSRNELTSTHSLGDQRGLSNLLAHSEEWLATIHSLSTSGLDFMPSGTTHWQHGSAESNLRKLSADFKKRYQFVCVCAGDALHSNPKLWSGVSDGTYLLVSMKNTNQDIAESSVTELQLSGARLLGCIVTDAELKF